MGDPMRLLLWVSKRRENLAVALRAMNYAISANTVGKMLVALGYSRQVNRKTNEGNRHPDHYGQFQHINQQVMTFQEAGQPVISVDTKEGGHRGLQERPQRLPRHGLSRQRPRV